MKLIGEYFSEAHPDRLADAIVSKIIKEVLDKTEIAICNLGCSIIKNQVFVFGNIIHDHDEDVMSEELIKYLVKDVYYENGYWKASKNNLSNQYFRVRPVVKGEEDDFDETIIEVIVNVEVIKDKAKVAKYKHYVFEQAIITGYAINSKETNYLPVASYIASSLVAKYEYLFSSAQYILSPLVHEKSKYISPCFKLKVELDYDGENYRYNEVVVQFVSSDKTPKERVLEKIEVNFSSLFDFKSDELQLLNPINKDKFQYVFINEGESNIGGPYTIPGSSSHLSRLDFYDSEFIPVNENGKGKDCNNINVCGAIRARQLAINLVRKYGYYSVFVRVVYLPNTVTPYLIEAYHIDKEGAINKIENNKLPKKYWFSKTAIFEDLPFISRDRPTSIRNINYSKLIEKEDSDEINRWIY